MKRKLHFANGSDESIVATFKQTFSTGFRAILSLSGRIINKFKHMRKLDKILLTRRARAALRSGVIGHVNRKSCKTKCLKRCLVTSPDELRPKNQDALNDFRNVKCSELRRLKIRVSFQRERKATCLLAGRITSDRSRLKTQNNSPRYNWFIFPFFAARQEWKWDTWWLGG